MSFTPCYLSLKPYDYESNLSLKVSRTYLRGLSSGIPKQGLKPNSGFFIYPFFHWSTS